MREKLEVKVRLVNRTNREAKELHHLLSNALTPFIGKQVVKADGSLMAKVEKAIRWPNPFLPYHGNNISVIFRPSRTGLCWTVTVRENTPSGSTSYHEANFCVGTLNNGVLTELTPYTPGRDDYTVEEVERLQQAYKAAKEAADRAHDALHPFCNI